MERLTEALDRAGLEAFVATSPANVAYITGLPGSTEASWRGRAFGVFARAGTALVAHALQVPPAAGEGIEVDHVVGFAGRAASRVSAPAGPGPAQTIRVPTLAGPGEALAAALQQVGVGAGKVGVDESRLAHDEWRHLAAQLPSVEVRPAAGDLAAARRVKGPYEIECLAHALRIAEEALDAVIQTIDRGMTEREAAILIATEVLKRGAWPRPPIVAMGERTVISVPAPTERALRSGQAVRFDVGCVYKGYCGAVSRSAVLGEAPAALEGLYRGAQAGLEAAIDAVHPGARAGLVFEAAEGAAQAHGRAASEQEDVGGGIGLESREAPELGGAAEAPLELGEVLRLELTRRDGSVGVSVQDTVLVTTAGARVLNRSHHGLVVLE